MSHPESWPEWVTATLASAALIAVSALAAWLTSQPLVFPSLGPTIYLMVESPEADRASPRNTVLAHLVGILAGWGALALFGLRATPSATEMGVSGPRVGAIVFALAVTGGITVALRASHPPAAATTLLVAMGTLRTPRQLLGMAAGVILLTAVALVVNRLRGEDVPLWTTRHTPKT